MVKYISQHAGNELFFKNNNLILFNADIIALPVSHLFLSTYLTPIYRDSKYDSINLT